MVVAAICPTTARSAATAVSRCWAPRECALPVTATMSGLCRRDGRANGLREPGVQLQAVPAGVALPLRGGPQDRAVLGDQGPRPAQRARSQLLAEDRDAHGSASSRRVRRLPY